MTLISTQDCPACGAANTRATASGLGGRWKVICSHCGHHFADCDGETADVITDIPDEEE